MLEIKYLPTTGYNAAGYPVCQKLIWHDGWYLVVSTTTLQSPLSSHKILESMVFLSDKHGARIYDNYSVATLHHDADYRSYETAERDTIQHLTDNLGCPRYRGNGVERWADELLQSLYYRRTGGREISRLIQAVARSYQPHKR